MVNLTPLILTTLTNIANEVLQNTLTNDKINDFKRGKHMSPGLVITDFK